MQELKSDTVQEYLLKVVFIVAKLNFDEVFRQKDILFRGQLLHPRLSEAYCQRFFKEKDGGVGQPHNGKSIKNPEVTDDFPLQELKHHDFLFDHGSIIRLFRRVNFFVSHEPRDSAMAQLQTQAGGRHVCLLTVESVLVGARDQLVRLIDLELGRAVKERQVFSLLDFALFVVCAGPDVGAT